jgi:hypothetical protein
MDSTDTSRRASGSQFPKPPNAAWLSANPAAKAASTNRIGTQNRLTALGKTIDYPSRLGDLPLSDCNGEEAMTAALSASA